MLLQKQVLDVVNVRQMVGRIVDADKGLLSTMFLEVGVRLSKNPWRFVSICHMP